MESNLPLACTSSLRQFRTALSSRRCLQIPMNEGRWLHTKIAVPITMLLRGRCRSPPPSSALAAIDLKQALAPPRVRARFAAPRPASANRQRAPPRQPERRELHAYVPRHDGLSSSCRETERLPSQPNKSHNPIADA